MRRPRLDVWMFRIADEPHLLVITLGCSLGFVMLTVLGFLLHLYLLASMSLILALGASVTLFAALRTHRRLASRQAQRLILRHLTKTGLKDFDLGRALGAGRLPQAAIRDASLAVYDKCVGKALADLEITQSERHVLTALREKLQLSAREAAKAEDRAKRELYRREVEQRLADGTVTEGEADDLKRIRAAIGLSDSEALDATRRTVQDAYKALFRRFAADGHLSAGELEELRRFSEATGLTVAEAAKISKKDALSLYRRTASMICQDGEVTQHELNELRTLEQILHLSKEDIAAAKQEVTRTMELGRIRGGDLPVLRTDGLLLKPTELCHWVSKCKYRYQTRTQTRELRGRLVVTDRRVILVSPQRSIEFSVNKILNITPRSDAVRLQLSRGPGQGDYLLPDPQKLEAVLYGLVRRRSFVVAQGTDSARTRHIPDDVKVEVWQRDGGTCVRCGATEYLEFDHIIPFSKGGSNSARNIQLLCRRCNLQKGPELV